MRHIDLSDYEVEGQQIDQETGEPTMVKQPFRVRRGLTVVLFGSNGHSAQEILTRDELSKHIEGQEGTALMVNDAEYKLLRDAFDKFTQFGRNDVELIKRVLNARLMPDAGERLPA